MEKKLASQFMKKSLRPVYGNALKRIWVVGVGGASGGLAEGPLAVPLAPEEDRSCAVLEGVSDGEVVLSPSVEGVGPAEESGSGSFMRVDFQRKHSPFPK